MRLVAVAFKSVFPTRVGVDLTPRIWGGNLCLTPVSEPYWATLKERMAAHNFGGEVVVSELVEEHLAEAEKLTENAEVVETVPEEVELPAQQA